MPTGIKVLPQHWQPTKFKRIHKEAQLNLRFTRLLAVAQGVFTAAKGVSRPETDVTQAEIEAAVLAVGAGSQRHAREKSS